MVIHLMSSKYLKPIFIFLILALIMPGVNAQQPTKVSLYDIESDPNQDLAAAMNIAAQSGKHVFLQIGGNWCKWCLRFHDFISKNQELDSILNKNYVSLHVNYSKENKNLPFMETLGFPQRFGFPVFVVMDISGNRIHTQSSWFLEDGKESYDVEKVKAFLLDWSPQALNPLNYREK